MRDKRTRKGQDRRTAGGGTGVGRYQQKSVSTTVSLTERTELAEVKARKELLRFCRPSFSSLCKIVRIQVSGSSSE
jgi:hypothetical protein